MNRELPSSFRDSRQILQATAEGGVPSADLPESGGPPRPVPPGIAGAVEELLGWHPEVPLALSAGGRLRPRMLKATTAGPPTLADLKAEVIGALALGRIFVHQIILEAMVDSASLAFFLAAAVVAIGSGFNSWLARGRHFAPRFAVLLGCAAECGFMILLYATSLFGLVERAPPDLVRVSLACIGMYALAFWVDAGDLAQASSKLQLDRRNPAEEQEGLASEVCLVAEIDAQSKQQASAAALRNFARDLDLLLESRRRLDAGEPVESSRLLALAELFGRSYPRGAGLYYLSDRSVAGELSGEELRTRLGMLLAAPRQQLLENEAWRSIQPSVANSVAS